MSDPLQRGNMGVESHHYVCIYYFGLLGMISEGEVEKMSKKVLKFDEIRYLSRF